MDSSVFDVYKNLVREEEKESNGQSLYYFRMNKNLWSSRFFSPSCLNFSLFPSLLPSSPASMTGCDFLSISSFMTLHLSSSCIFLTERNVTFSTSCFNPSSFFFSCVVSFLLPLDPKEEITGDAKWPYNQNVIKAKRQTERDGSKIQGNITECHLYHTIPVV